MKWREARSPPAWQTLETLSPWCSWTAQPQRTSSTASRAAASARARPAAILWIAPPRWNGVACGDGPRSWKSRSPIWRMWTPSTAGHGSSSLPCSPSLTSSTGSTMSDGTVLVTCLLLFLLFLSFPFSVAFLHNQVCRVKDCHVTKNKKADWRNDWVLDLALIRNVFIFAVFVSLVQSFYFLNMYCNRDMWQSSNNSPSGNM